MDMEEEKGDDDEVVCRVMEAGRWGGSRGDCPNTADGFEMMGGY